MKLLKLKALKPVIFIIGIIVSTHSSQAQNKISINGKVISNEGVAISNVNVVLLKSNTDTTIVSLASSNSNGVFTIENTSGDLRPMRFSCLGYKTKLMLADSGNVGNIILIPESINIDEVAVVGSSKTYRPDGITYFPTAKMQKKSINGMSLLSAIQPPRVYIDPVSFNVSVLGGGSIVLLINDRPATSEEIQGINPDHIKRVDYFDKPTPRFPTASVVVSFTVETPDRGGSASGNLIEGINGVYGEHYVSARAFSGRHAFSLDWRPQFRYSNDLMRERYDIFNLPTGIVTRNEIALPAKQEYWNNRATTHYNYSGKKVLFDFSAFGQFNNERHNDYSGLVVTQKLNASDTITNHDRNSNELVSGGVNAYFEVKTPIGPIRLNADYSYRDANYNRNYEEQLYDSTFTLNSHNTENVHFTGLQFSYSLPIPMNEKWMWLVSASGKWNSAWYNNSYFTDYGSSSVNTKQNSGENSLTVMLNSQKLMFGLGAVHTWQKHNIDDNCNTWSQLSPLGVVMYKPFKKWTITLDALFKYSPPTLSQIISSEIQLDPYQIQRGNTNLESTQLMQFTLNNNVGISKKFELFVQGKYKYCKNPIFEITVLEQQEDLNHMVVRMPMNINSFTQYTLSGSIRGNELWKLFSFKLWGGFDYATSNNGSNFKHDALTPFCQGQITVAWKKWDLLSELWYGKADALQGEMLQKDEVTTRFMLSYQHNRLKASIGVMNPFIKYKDTKYENLSSIAPYTRYAYSKMYNNLILAKLTFLVSWGKEQKSQSRPQLNGQESENTIVKSGR